MNRVLVHLLSLIHLVVVKSQWVNLLCLNEQSSCSPVVSDPRSVGEEPVGEFELCLNEQSSCPSVVSYPLSVGEEPVDELELCLNEQGSCPPVVSNGHCVQWGSLYFGDSFMGLCWLSVQQSLCLLLW